VQQVVVAEVQLATSTQHCPVQQMLACQEALEVVVPHNSGKAALAFRVKDFLEVLDTITLLMVVVEAVVLVVLVRMWALRL
jgi:hypothetical protein